MNNCDNLAEPGINMASVIMREKIWTSGHLKPYLIFSNNESIILL